MGVGVGIAIALTVISTGISYAQQQAQKRHLRRNLQRANTLDIRPTNAGLPVIVPYGRTAVQGVIVYKNTERYTHDPDTPLVVAPNDTPPVYRGRMPAYGDYDDDQIVFLLHQAVVGPAGVNKIVDCVIQSESLFRGQYAGTAIMEAILNGDTWSRFAVSMFGPLPDTAPSDAIEGPIERTLTTRGTGLATVNLVYRRNLRKPIYAGEPDGVVQIVEGMRTAPLEDGVNPATAARTFSPTLPRALHHYCTQDDYGPGPDRIKLNVQSFRDSETIAKVVVQGAGTEDTAKQEALDAWNEENGTNLTLQQFEDAQAQAAQVAGGYNPFANSGFASGPATGTADQAAAMEILRHEFNGAVSTDEEFRDVFETILAPCPGAVFFRDELGRRNLVLPDPSNLTNRTTTTLNEGDTVGQIRIEGPDPNEYLNQITVRFANLNKNYAEDSVTFPATGSTLHDSLLAEDNQVAHQHDLHLHGVNNKYAAKAIAANYLFQSRRDRYEFTATAKHFRLQPNDEIRLVIPSMGLDKNILAKTKTYDFRRHLLTFTGIEYVEADYVWGITELDTISDQEAVEYSLADPTNVTISRSGAVLSGSWDYDPGSSTAEVVAFDVDISRDGGTTWTGSRIVQGQARNFRTNMAFTPGSYRIRVAARGIYGNQSSFVESGDISVPSITVTNAGYLELRLWQLTRCTTTRPTVTVPDEVRVNMRTQTIQTALSVLAPWTIIEPIPDVTYDRYEYAKWEIRAHIIDVDVGLDGTTPSRLHTIDSDGWEDEPRVVDTFDSSSIIYRRGTNPPHIQVRDGYRGTEWVPRS